MFEYPHDPGDYSSQDEPQELSRQWEDDLGFPVSSPAEAVSLPERTLPKTPEEWSSELHRLREQKEAIERVAIDKGENPMGNPTYLILMGKIIVHEKHATAGEVDKAIEDILGE